MLRPTWFRRGVHGPLLSRLQVSAVGPLFSNQAQPTTSGV